MSNETECKRLIADKAAIKYEMGGIEVAPPSDRRWTNPMLELERMMADHQGQLRRNKKAPSRQRTAAPPARDYSATTVRTGALSSRSRATQGPGCKAARRPAEATRPSGRQCSKCKAHKEEGDFSGEQWKLGKARKCRACVVPG